MKVVTKADGELDYIVLQPQRKGSRSMRNYKRERHQLELLTLDGNKCTSARRWRDGASRANDNNKDQR